MLRRAVSSDIPAMEAFLSDHAETSMFARNNLLSHGVGQSDHAHATDFVLRVEGNLVTGLLGKTNHGFMVTQVPDNASDFYVQAAEILGGQAARGMTGVPEQVETAFDAFGFQDADFLVNKDEPLYAIAVEDVASVPAQMRRAKAQDAPLLQEWFTGFAMDTGLASSLETAQLEGAERAANAVNSPDVMILEEGGHPVAMAGINARLPDMVQVGGVFTPKDARGQGYARRAVAGLLRHQPGVTRAILFAADEFAARAYEAIGFDLIGAYRVAMLREAQVIKRPV